VCMAQRGFTSRRYAFADSIYGGVNPNVTPTGAEMTDDGQNGPAAAACLGITCATAKDGIWLSDHWQAMKRDINNKDRRRRSPSETSCPGGIRCG